MSIKLPSCVELLPLPPFLKFMNPPALLGYPERFSLRRDLRNKEHTYVQVFTQNADQ